MIQEVWIRGLQKEHQTPPVEGQLFQFHLYYVLFELHIFEEEIVKHVFLEIFLDFFLDFYTKRGIILYKAALFLCTQLALY